MTTFDRGDIYRGSISEPTADVFIPGDKGSEFFFSAGIKATSNRLVVVQGSDSDRFVTAFERPSGDPVVRFAMGSADAGPNDVAIAPNGDAYVTDSSLPVLYRIPAAALQQGQRQDQDLPVFMSLQGTPFEYVPNETNANGIVVSADNKFLLVVSYETGQLFRIRLADQEVTQVRLEGASLAGGDGMILTGNTLHVVLAGSAQVVKLAMSDGYTQGRQLSETSDATFQTPTTAAIAGDRLLVVNSQFTGPEEPPWTVSSIPLP